MKTIVLSVWTIVFIKHFLDNVCNLRKFEPKIKASACFDKPGRVLVLIVVLRVRKQNTKIDTRV